MKILLNFIRPATATLGVGLTILGINTSVKGDIFGFGVNGTGWTINGSSAVTSDVLRVTPQNILQAGSAFYNVPQNINSFTAVFNYHASNTGGGDTADGMVFVLQNQGPTALGANGGNLGYVGISNATGVAFNLLANGATPGTGYAPTSVPYNYQSVAPVNMLNPLTITLTYNGSILSEMIHDNVSGANFNTAYTVNLPAAVGGSTAYVGFTGGTGLGAALQLVDHFSYVVPEPSVISISLLAIGISLFRRRPR
jgi:hypothetical protein